MRKKNHVNKRKKNNRIFEKSTSEKKKAAFTRLKSSNARVALVHYSRYPPECVPKNHPERGWKMCTEWKEGENRKVEKIPRADMQLRERFEMCAFSFQLNGIKKNYG